MKNLPQPYESTRADFDSLNMLESVLENNQARNSVYFSVESSFGRRRIYHFDFFLCFAQHIFGKLKKN